MSNTVKVLILILLSISLMGCSVENPEETEAREKAAEELRKEKQITFDKMKVKEENEEEYNKLKSEASEEQMNMVAQEMISSEVAYQHLKNLGKEVNNDYEYMFIVRNDDKFQNLYQHVVLELADTYEANILLYFPSDKKEGVSFPTNRTNIDVKYESDTVKGLENVEVNYTPTFIAKDSEGKVFLTLLGFYDYNVLLDKITSFGKVE